MANNDRPQTFDELINEVQQLPDPFKPPTGDSASPFSVPLPPGDRFRDTSKELLLHPDAQRDFTYKHESEVYNLCNREERAAYDEQQTEIANNKLLVMRRDEVHWTKEGDGLALLQWIELIPNKDKAAARLRREAPAAEDDLDG